MHRSSTVQELADHLDQLDLAIDKLSYRDRNFDRFALLIVDNVAELILHAHAESISRTNAYGFEPPKYNPALVRRAIGHYFGDKVKLARKTQYVTDVEATSVMELHRFRNSAHHQGARHEGLISSLALFYIRTLAGILERHVLTGWSRCSTDVVSHRAVKYLGRVGNHDHVGDKFKAAWTRVIDVASSLRHDLIQDLGRSAEEYVSGTDEMIRFVCEDGPEQLERDMVIRSAQSSELAFGEECRAFAEKRGFVITDNTSVTAYLEWLDKNYPWPFPKDPIPNWRIRASEIQRESCEHRALAKYADLMKQGEELDPGLSKMAGALDRSIQLEVDMALGK